MRSLNTVVYFVLASVLLLGIVTATSAIGSSKISLTSSKVLTNNASTAQVGYTVTLVGGTSGSTLIQVTNAGTLKSADNISVTLMPSSSDPTFTGRMFITTGYDTPIGSYQINLIATGADPSLRNATFTVLVGQLPPNQLTTTVQAATATTSVLPSGTATSSTYDEVLGVIIVLIILLIVSLYLRQKNRR